MSREEQREEFRRRLMNYGKSSDLLVESVIVLSIELGMSSDEIMDMPSSRFDLYAEAVIKRAKALSGGKKQPKESTFSDVM